MDIPGYLRARATRILSFSGCLLGLFAIHFVIFRDHWLGRKWFPFDFPAGYYATVAYWVTSLQSGEWPQWIPYQSMGYPLLMNPQIGFFYPPFWTFVVLHISYTLHAAVIVQILHILFASVGILLLANRLFGSLLAAECGAAAFLLFGSFFTNAEHADIIRGFAWVPWLLWAAIATEKSLDTRNCMLPLLLACFITGAYTGQVIAGMFLVGVFLLVQAAQQYYIRRERAVIKNLFFEFGLIGLGVLLASAFLLTGAALTGELTRSRGVSSLPVTYLTGRNLFELVFPSDLMNPGQDYSMSGMQLPIVLLLFVPLISLKFLKRLVPILVVAGFAAVMAFTTFAAVNRGIRHLFPVLSLSRFPAADYREFVCLAVLLLATGGLASTMHDSSEHWKKTAGTLFMCAVFGLVCLTCLQHDIAPQFVSTFLRIAKGAMFAALGVSFLVWVCCWLRRPKLLGIALLPLIPIIMFPAIDSEKRFWADPDLLKNVYDGHGFPLQVNGELRTKAIFRRKETSRGPRVFADNIHLPSWWGYLEGAYLTNDSGGVVPLTRRTAEENPEILQFVEAPSQILQIPCDTDQSACAGESPVVELSNQPRAGKPIEYSRNSIAYEVNVSSRSLVVENEMAIRGWRASVDGTKVPVGKVNGCLRGWIVPAGKHLVRLRYQTPLLLPGILLSGVGFAAWLVILWLVHPAVRVKKPAEDCVILVSSDRTGG